MIFKSRDKAGMLSSIEEFVLNFENGIIKKVVKNANFLWTYILSYNLNQFTGYRQPKFMWEFLFKNSAVSWCLQKTIFLNYLTIQWVYSKLKSTWLLGFCSCPNLLPSFSSLALNCMFTNLEFFVKLNLHNKSFATWEPSMFTKKWKYGNFISCIDDVWNKFVGPQGLRVLSGVLTLKKTLELYYISTLLVTVFHLTEQMIK